MFAWFGSEETGGFGARNFLDHPPVPLDRIVANLEFEMIGRPDEKVAPHTLWLTGYERSNLGPELARRGARIVGDPALLLVDVRSDFRRRALRLLAQVGRPVGGRRELDRAGRPHAA